MKPEEFVALVPPAVVHPRAQKLDRRLRAVKLGLRHVQVVDLQYTQCNTAPRAHSGSGNTVALDE